MSDIKLVDTSSSSTTKSQLNPAAADGAAIARLRKSRDLYRQNLRIDAKKTGREWVNQEASYEQVLLVLRVHEDNDFSEVFDSDELEALVGSIERRLDALSGVVAWRRDDFWMNAFLGAAVERWREIAAQVERDG